MKLSSIISVLTALVCLLGFSSNGTAQNLGACPPGGCACTPADAEDYDSCTLTKKFVDPLDIDLMRDRIEFTLEGTSGLPDISMHVQRNTILEVNDHNGDWPSVSELEDYVNELVYGPGGASSVPFEPIDICDIPLLSPAVSGRAPRLNTATNGWASYQTGNVLWSAIASDNGEIRVNGETVWNVPTLDPTTLYCEQGQDGPLEARVCSIIRETTGAENSAVSCSPEFGSEGTVLKEALGRIDNIKINGSESEWLYDAGSNIVGVKAATAEYLELHDEFYDGTTPDPLEAPNVIHDTDYHEDPRAPRDGVCTDGDVWEGIHTVEGETRTGTAPSECHGVFHQ